MRLEVLGACPHDCPDTCALVTTVEDGVATSIRGSREHPITQGRLCAKVNRYLERTYHPERLLRPLRRVGSKGEGAFEECTWDEAVEGIAHGLRDRIAAHGPQTVLPYSYAGTMGALQYASMSSRFFHRIGASLLARTICSTAGKEGWLHTYGSVLGTDPREAAKADVVVLWGTNTLTSNPHFWPFARQARERGGTIVCIDPIRTRTARASDVHIAPRPGTDAALALSVMHVLFRDGYADEAFLERRAFGWREMRERVLGEWEPARAARVCDIPRESIEQFAALYGSSPRTYLRPNYGLQRHAGGGMAMRAISLLPTVTGAWRHEGGGGALSTSGAFCLNSFELDRPDWVPSGTRTINMNRLGEALTAPDGGVGGPPVTALVVFNSNPAAVAPDLGRVHEGLRREDLLTVAIEQFPTDTVDYADWVLPATTQLEHWDLHTTYGHHFVTLNTPAIEPLGECVPNTEAFRRLAKAMGLTDPEFEDTDRELIAQALRTDAPSMRPVTVAALERQGWVELEYPRRPYAEGRLATPSGLIQCVAPALGDMGLDPLPDYVPPAELDDPDDTGSHPLTLLTPPAHEFLNSSFANVPVLAKAAGEPRLLIHPHDAAARDISHQSMVIAGNERGSFRCAAAVTDEVRPGTVVCYGIRWVKDSGGAGHVNETTSMRLTDLGGGATFYDNAVDVWPA